MDNITREYIKEINDELAKDMIALGSRELTLANVMYTFCSVWCYLCHVVCYVLFVDLFEVCSI